MNFLINGNFHTKISIYSRKFFSSLAAIENSSALHGKRDQNLGSFDPFQVLNRFIKSRECDIRNTKIIHTHLLKASVLQSDIVFTNSLLDGYCKSAAMGDALKLFDSITDPNAISWNIVISGYNQCLQFEEAWRFFCKMRLFDFEPNEITYLSVLSACTALEAPVLGKQVYSLAIRSGFNSSGYVRAGMINLFAKLCRFMDAKRVFDDVCCGNVVCWNSIISAAVRNGENLAALDLFRQMCHGFVLPNTFTFSSTLTACAALGEFKIGKGVQAWVIKCGAEDLFVGTAIIDLYSKCGYMDDALKEFLQMPIRNVVSWTAIISGLVLNDDSISALKIFREMRIAKEEMNNYTVSSVITACAKSSMFKEALQIHSWIIKAGFCTHPVISAALINMYSKVGAIDLSDMVFGEMDNVKHMGIWAGMISSFAQNQNSERAIELFRRMLQNGMQPDLFCSSSVLSVVECLWLGRQIHCYTVKNFLVFDASVGSSLFRMYLRCDYLEESYEVFKQIIDKDNVSWASMISGFTNHGHAHQALQLFGEMLFEETEPDEITLSAILTACSAFHYLLQGKEIHGYALRKGIDKEAVVGSALVTMYSKCGNLETARRVFELLPRKDKVSCSSLVSGYAQNGMIEEALLLFHEMLMADLAIDAFTISSILWVIAILNRPGIGTQLHARITKIGLDSDVSVGSSLVTMYSKCGGIDDCCRAFVQIKKPDLIGWTAMIMSYAQHGEGADALRIYELMRKESVKPDPVTFVGVLSACSHSGLIEEGYFHFDSMTKDYGIIPNYRHYACMVDLLGRSGRLDEAERFITNMPTEPNSTVWATLLAACKVHGNVELGKVAAKKVIELEPSDTGAYVSLSNIYADMGQWEEVLDVRSLMRRTIVDKEPGWSVL